MAGLQEHFQPNENKAAVQNYERNSKTEPQSASEKKVYSKSFLLSIQNAMMCQKKHVMLNNEWDHLTKQPSLDSEMKLLKVSSNAFGRYKNHKIRVSLKSSQKTSLLNGIDQQEIDQILMLCEKIIYRYILYKHLKGLVNSFDEDESFIIHSKTKEFIKIIILSTNDSKLIGTIFAEMLSESVIIYEDLVEGIDEVLKCDQSILYIAMIISQLLNSKIAVFDFINFKDSCSSVISFIDKQIMFICALRGVIKCGGHKNDIQGISLLYKKWFKSIYIPLNTFLSVDQINAYFFCNNDLGIFFLSAAIYDNMLVVNNKQSLFAFELDCYISIYIDEEVIISPEFIKALTIANVLFCLKESYSTFPYEDFFDTIQLKLLKRYIWYGYPPEHILSQIQERELQCMYGVQTILAALEYPKGMIPILLDVLNKNGVISKSSLDVFMGKHLYKN